MPLEYTLSIEGELLHVTTAGFDDGLEEAVSYCEAIIECCIENQCKQVLMDESAMTGSLDEQSQYQMVQRLLGQIPFGLDIAIVVNSHNRKETSFGVMVAENRGVHVNIFSDVGAAMVWLQEQKTV